MDVVVATPTRIHSRHAHHQTRHLMYGFAIAIGIVVGIIAGGTITTLMWVILPTYIGSVGTALLSIIGGGAVLAGLLWRWAR